MVKREGVKHGQLPEAAHAGVPATNGRAVSTRTFVQRARRAVRLHELVVRMWVKQADRDGGKGDRVLTTVEREALSRLWHENRKLREVREILSKATAWFANEVCWSSKPFKVG